MFRSLSVMLLLTSLFAMSSCAVTDRGPHSVCRAWADYNTLRAPALYLEQDDHLPYPATQVGYYRWMYDKDPGHQFACLGAIPPRTCPNCDPVPPGDQPFEYQVYFPSGIPRPSDELWGNKLPEPVNVPAPAHAELRPNLSPPGGSAPPTSPLARACPLRRARFVNRGHRENRPFRMAENHRTKRSARKSLRDCRRSIFRLRSRNRSTRHPLR